jgi:hypothetical protein
MRAVIRLILVVILASLPGLIPASAQRFNTTPTGGGGGGCNTSPGLTCDANGFTILTAQAGACEGFACTPTGGFGGTRIIYVSSSTGCDNGVGGCTNDGSWSQPAQTVLFAMQHMRGGSPDWLLMKCGDTFVNQGADLVQHIPGNNASGLSPTLPMVVAGYDGTIDNKIPDPTSCPGGRPVFANDNTAPFECTSAGSYVAFLGFVCKAVGRDPNDPSFTFAHGNADCCGVDFFHNFGSLLIEDVTFSYGVGYVSMNTSRYPTGQAQPQPSSVVFRRSGVIGGYGSAFENGGVVWANNRISLSFVFEENLIDHNGWNLTTTPYDGGGTLTFPSSGFTHNIYIPGSNVNGDVLSTGAPQLYNGNIFSNEAGGPAFRLAGNFTNNLFMHNTRAMDFQEPTPGFNAQVTGNVLVDGTAICDVLICGAGGSTGIELISRYISEAVAVGSSTVTSNIIANAPGDINAKGIAIGERTSGDVVGGLTNQTISGNYLYNWGWNNPSNDLIYNGTGQVCSGTVTAGGSGYTDQPYTFTNTFSSTNAVLGNGGTVTAKIDDGSGGPGSILTVTSSSAGTLSTGVAQYSIIGSTINAAGIPGGTRITGENSPFTGFGDVGTYGLIGFFSGGLIANPLNVQPTGSSYNSGTGVVTLNLDFGPLNVGDTITVGTLTGGGADLALAQGPQTLTGVSGTTASYTIATGKTITSITAGSLRVTGLLIPSESMTVGAVNMSTNGDQQGYIVLGGITTNIFAHADMPSTGPVYIVGSGLASAVYQGQVLDSGHYELFGTTAGSSFSGTMYTPTLPGSAPGSPNFTYGGAGTGLVALMFSVGGSVPSNGIYLLGDDAISGNYELPAGAGYSGGDVLNFTNGTGTGAQLTVGSLCSNTINTSLFDPTGTNSNGWPDPNRQPGAYYATGGNALTGSTWTPTANGTGTGSITNGVLTLTSFTGPLSNGDAITWTGATKSDYINTFGGSNVDVQITPVSVTGGGLTQAVLTWNGTTVSAAFPAGSVGNGYTVGDTFDVVGGTHTTAARLTVSATFDSGIVASFNVTTPGSYSALPPIWLASKTNASPANSGAVTVNSYSTQQLIALQRLQNKQSWNPNLTACVIGNWFRDGFGVAHVTCPPGG